MYCENWKKGNGPSTEMLYFGPINKAKGSEFLLLSRDNCTGYKFDATALKLDSDPPRLDLTDSSVQSVSLRACSYVNGSLLALTHYVTSQTDGQLWIGIEGPKKAHVMPMKKGISASRSFRILPDAPSTKLISSHIDGILFVINGHSVEVYSVAKDTDDNNVMKFKMGKRDRTIAYFDPNDQIDLGFIDEQTKNLVAFSNEQKVVFIYRKDARQPNITIPFNDFVICPEFSDDGDGSQKEGPMDLGKCGFLFTAGMIQR